MNTTQPSYLSIPLGQDAHRSAQQFAAEQATTQKGKQVYLNTLAVYGVHSYLKWLSVESALTQSDSWHSGLRAVFNVADLVLPNIGKLECIPVLPGDTHLKVPPEATQERIGYVAVQINQSLDAVQLLGFASADAVSEFAEEIPLSQLQSLDALVDAIEHWQHLVNLRQWLEGIFSADWQSADRVLAPHFRSFPGIRSAQQQDTLRQYSISRAKPINLSRSSSEEITTVLMIRLMPTADSVEICLRLYPAVNRVNLPTGVSMTVIDETGTTCMNVQAGRADDWMQLEFSCQQGEQFSVQLTLDDQSVIEQFLV